MNAGGAKARGHPVKLRRLADGRSLDPAHLIELLPPGGLTLVSSCSAESALLADAVAAAGAALGAMRFGGIFVPGVNRRVWLAGPDSRVVTFFMTPELAAVADRVDFLPLCYADILAWLRVQRPAAALIMCSPPDDDGWCSFGSEAGFLADLWPDIPIRIAHVNPAMPRTRGNRGIRFDALTAFVTQDDPLLAVPAPRPDALAQRLAAHVAAVVPDHATLQTGVGKIPDAVLGALTTRRGLRLHSGLIGDGVLALLDAGALALDSPITAGVAIGSAALYARLSEEAFQFQAVSVTHCEGVLRTIDPLVTINSAIEVDLFGQAFAEVGPAGLTSGPGGAADFARGAGHGNGLRIIALPATAANGARSRIVAAGAGTGPVSLARADIDLVATEHGIADLRSRTHAGRAAALIAVAAPDHRAALRAAWDQTLNQLQPGSIRRDQP